MKDFGVEEQMDISEYKVILASKSPRRRELLSKLVSKFDVIVKEIDESLPSGVHPSLGVELLAMKKGDAVAADNRDSIVISSDTLVELDGEALGKPVDEADASRMLHALSGKEHNVHTGVAVHYLGRAVSGVATARVRFRSLSDDEIAEYIAGGEPMDKAGSYAIQGEGGKFIANYDGGFDTVMGLSVSLTKRLIADVLGDM